MKNILLVEGNLREVNQEFTDNGIKTHTESLRESIDYFTNNLEIDTVNPSSDNDIFNKVKDLNKYDGLIWGGSSLNIYSDTIEIRRQIDFMKECQKKVKNILAICWGLQVAVTAAGGEVKKGNNGAHRGIAHEIIINSDGLKHLLYKDKIQNFNTPAFNYDEVEIPPNNSVLLASNEINKYEALYFTVGKSEIWGLQYHPEIPYDYMIKLIKHRSEKMIERNVFKDQNEINTHVKSIEKAKLNLSDDIRTLELKNWLNYLKNNNE